MPAARRGWLPLLAGVALAEAVGEVTGVRASLKWPNDLLAADGRKLAGILAESSGTAVVVGVGLNVSTTAEELPDTGTSLAQVAGTTVDRAPVLLALPARGGAAVPALGRVARRSGLLRAGPGLPGLVARTVGTEVAVSLPGRLDPRGDGAGGRLGRPAGGGDPGGTVELASGDVRHVRRV